MKVENEIAREAEISDDLLLPTAKIANRRLEELEDAYRSLLEAIGEDPDREGLRRTPVRAAHALEFLTQGYRQDLEEIINDAVFASDASEIILVKDIELYRCASTICFPSSAARTLLTFQTGK